jgi:hypothetical protein
MSAGITLATVGTAVGIAGGINSLTGGGVSKMLGFGGSATGAEAQRMADPFMDYRANLGAMYSGALQPGAKANIESMPGFSQYKTGVMDPAMEAQQRKAASSGMLYSGNEAMALQKTGQQGYYGFMTDYLNRLAQGSGAAQNPATAAGMGLGQQQLNQQGFMQGMGALGQIAGQYGGSGAPDVPTYGTTSTNTNPWFTPKSGGGYPGGGGSTDMGD